MQVTVKNGNGKTRSPAKKSVVISTTVKQKRKRARKRSSRKRGNSYLRTMAGQLSDCAQGYLLALTDPFDFAYADELPCIPDVISVPSSKTMARGIGTFIANSAGDGWIFFNPWLFMSGLALGAGACDAPLIFTSTTANSSAAAAYITSGGVATDVGVIPLSTAQLQSNISASNLKNQGTQGNLYARYRLVGAGLKISYTGTLLNQSGSVVMLRHKDSRSLITINANTAPAAGFRPLYADFLVDPANEPRSVVAGQEYSVCYRPTDTFYVSYSDIANFLPSLYGSNINNYGGWTLGAYVSGLQPGASFRYEAISLVEIVGNNCGPVTDSSCDPVGYATVLNTLPGMDDAVSPQERLNKAIDVIPQAASHLSYLMTAGGLLAGAGGTRLLEYVTRQNNAPRRLVRPEQVV